MKRKNHYIALFNYQDKLFLFESIESRLFFLGDFMSQFVDACLRDDPLHGPVTDLEVSLNGEPVLFLPSFSFTADIHRCNQSTGSSRALRG